MEKEYSDGLFDPLDLAMPIDRYTPGLTSHLSHYFTLFFLN